MGEIINGDNSNTFSIIRYGLGNIKMIENLLSIGLTTICGIMAMYWFYKSMSNYCQLLNNNG